MELIEDRWVKIFELKVASETDGACIVSSLVCSDLKGSDSLRELVKANEGLLVTAFGLFGLETCPKMIKKKSYLNIFAVEKDNQCSVVPIVKYGVLLGVFWLNGNCNRVSALNGLG